MSLLHKLLRPALFQLDPETAHALALSALKLVPSCSPVRDLRLNITAAGLDFPNPLGMAAGFDKNANVFDDLLRIGFGFTEVGTITPLPQAGNPKPRVFRLIEDKAVINRLGFNNEGHEASLARLTLRKKSGGIVGVNIGANKDSADRVQDYVLGITRFYGVADYFTVNISSPNTPGLRDLQARDSLNDLLQRVMMERDNQAQMCGVKKPVFLKIAPDLIEQDLDDIAGEIIINKLEGVIVSNTTLAREGLTSSQKQEAGGLSGAPLFEKSTRVLAQMRARLGKNVVIIGVGGVDKAENVITKIEAGADLVQLYTGFIYGGLGLPHDIVAGLSHYLDQNSVAKIADLRDRSLAHWSAS
jgi:dihydroorotate dehydrogenase